MLGRKSDQGSVDPIREGHLHGASPAHDRQKLLVLVESRAIVIARLEKNRINRNV